MSDVVNELIFDAGDIWLKGKDKARETDAEKIKQRHGDGRERVLYGDKDKQHGENGGVGGLSKKESGGTLEIVDGLAPLGDDSGNGRKIVAE